MVPTFKYSAINPWEPMLYAWDSIQKPPGQVHGPTTSFFPCPLLTPLALHLRVCISFTSRRCGNGKRRLAVCLEIGELRAVFCVFIARVVGLYIHKSSAMADWEDAANHKAYLSKFQTTTTFYDWNNFLYNTLCSIGSVMKEVLQFLLSCTISTHNKFACGF